MYLISAISSLKLEFMNIKELEISNPLKSREKKQKGVQSGANGQCRDSIPKKEISKEGREGEVCHCDWQGRCLDAVQVLLGCLPPSASPTSSISSSPISPFDGLPDLIVLYLVPVQWSHSY